MEDLLSAIKEAQRIRDLNDGAFADFLDVHYSLWSKIKNGQVKMSHKFLVAVAVKIPGLQLSVMNFMIKEQIKSMEKEGNPIEES